MKMMFLAALAALSLGVGAANAQSMSHASPTHQNTAPNFMEGGGG